MIKLTNKKANSLSFLTFSIICLMLFNYTSDNFTKIIDLTFSIISFILAAVLYLKHNFTLPLIPCKNRCSNQSSILCKRDKGFIGGIILSFLFLTIIKFENFNFIWKINKYYYLLIGILLISTTIIHGTFRRIFRLFEHYETLTFIIGLLTGLGSLFIALFFIMV